MAYENHIDAGSYIGPNPYSAYHSLHPEMSPISYEHTDFASHEHDHDHDHDHHIHEHIDVADGHPQDPTVATSPTYRRVGKQRRIARSNRNKPNVE